MKQQALYKITGMQKDVADSSADKQHAYDLHNMRLRHSDTNALTALVNEDGNLKARDKNGKIVTIKGTVIGFNTLNDQAILFTHEESGVRYVDSITDREEVAATINSESGTVPVNLIAAPSHPLTPTLCSFRCIAGDSDRSYKKSSVTINFETVYTEEMVVFMVTEFYLDWSKYGPHDDTTVVHISLSGADNFALMQPSSQQVFPQGIDISAEIARGVSEQNPYIFYVRFTRSSELDRTEATTFSCSVILSATDIAQSAEIDSTLSDTQITLNVTAPALQPDPGPGDGGTTEEGVYDPVICDYDEESSALAKCDHIYIITTSERSRAISGNKTATEVFEYFRGNLGFSLEHPIESTVYFENEKVQKIYWVDGIHQMRYANIADRNGSDYWSDNLMFDSVPLLHLQEDVKVTRNSTGGMFPSGTVQWACTYMNRYGAESNIFWISPIHYSSPDDRGGAPGENCANSFTITINKYEPKGRFDYIRLYHIVHTSIDQQVDVRRVADIPVPSHTVKKTINNEEVDVYPAIVYTDTNTTGETVDPNELLYLGGISVYPNTIEQKSNTLFLGNLEQQYDTLRESLSGAISWGGADITFAVKKTNVPEDRFSGYYNHENQLRYDSYNITTFQRGEDYRFGFQAQDKTGRWSDVWWLCDKRNDNAFPTFSGGYLHTVHATFSLSQDVVTRLRAKGYRKVRPVVIYPQPWERNIYTNGLLNPTVYNVKDRSANAPFAQSSWFIRPFSPIDMTSITMTGLTKDNYGNYEWDNVNHYVMPIPEFTTFYNNFDSDNMLSSIVIDASFVQSNGSYKFMDDYVRFGSWAEFRHNHPLGDSQQRNGEIPTMYNPRESFNSALPLSSGQHKYSITFPYTAVTAEARRDFINKVPDYYYVDQSILTLNSADLEFDDTLKATKLDNCRMRVVGLIPINSFISSFDIMTNTPPNKFYTDENNGMVVAPGLYTSTTIGAKMTDYGHGWKSLINAPLWFDDIAWNTVSTKNDSRKYKNEAATPVGFAVYPWQGSGSLNNDSIGSRKTYPSVDDKEESLNAVGDNYISAELKTKTLANLHYSWKTVPVNRLSYANELSVKAKTVLDEQQVSLTSITEPANSGLGTLHYFGSADKLITPISGAFSTTSGEDDDVEVIADGYKYPLSRYGGYPRMASFFPLMNHKVGTNDANRYAFGTPYTTLRYAGTVNSSLPNFNVLGVSLWFDVPDLKQGSDRTMSTVAIKYKSCNHAVIALDYKSSSQQCLDWLRIGHSNNNCGYGFWDHSKEYYSGAELFTVQTQDIGDVFDSNDVRVETTSDTNTGFDYVRFFPNLSTDNNTPLLCGYLYMGQLVHDTVDNKFGGTTEEAMEQNVWLPAGKAVYLVKDVGDNGLEIEWSAGDTYYQRYDALRTYPFTEEDQNKVIDIVSFMTETHVNIDGRYDKNRGLTNNNHVRPKNFNLLNHVYSQKDNFFTYKAVNSKKVNLSVFEYSFSWSQPKVPGALRDEWTHNPFSYGSTYNCDGNKGRLNRIVRLDNLLVGFQENGVSQILFNENVQIQGSEGLPIELANSGKLQGLRYYTTEVGCQNKWSIAVQPNGIYWVDGRTQAMYALNGDGMQPLSDLKGLSVWFKNRGNLSTVWHPGKWQGYFMHSDKTTGELYFTGADTSLCYDTLLGEFTSFYDYQKTTAMFTLNNTVFSIAADRSIPDSVINEFNGSLSSDHIWMHRSGKDHCYIYNKQCPAWVEIICNSNNQGNDYGTDKVFDNLEWRADAWQWNNNDASWTYKPFVTFDGLHGSNNYQRFDLALTAVNGDAVNNSIPQNSTPATQVNLRKKFKIWHTTMPRANEMDGSGVWVQTRDRVRDTWCHIKLELSSDLSRYRHILHDLSVTYFIP